MLSYRKPTPDDIELYFYWVNDPQVRTKSYSFEKIDFESHKKWFYANLEDPNCMMLVFESEKEKKEIGQIRIAKQNKEEAIIAISIAAEFRGRGYAKEMLTLASDLFLKSNPTFTIHAYIKKENLYSKKSFERAGFVLQEIMNYQNFESFHYIKKSLHFQTNL